MAASHTMEIFCRKSRLYSGNGKDRGDTAQYARRATAMVENESFCIESKLILDSVPAISTSDSSTSSQYGPSALIGATTSLLENGTREINEEVGDETNADLTPI
mmetsp:Transcript_32539/g.68429  ORF Transcript_32539/g.68429 Transcript_32539/m.68429 type:complete len:104 (-) Transcript_32539:2405-2716(-)